MGTIWILHSAYNCYDDENALIYLAQWRLVSEILASQDIKGPDSKADRQKY